MNIINSGPTSSDTEGTEVIGTALSPVTVGTTYAGDGIQSGFTDVSGYSQCAWHVHVTGVAGAGRIDVAIDWSSDGGATTNPQGTENISAGVSTLSVYEAQRAVSGADQLPAITLPVTAPLVRVKVKTDAGTADVYVTAVRQA